MFSTNIQGDNPVVAQVSLNLMALKIHTKVYKNIYLNTNLFIAKHNSFHVLSYIAQFISVALRSDHCGLTVEYFNINLQ